MWEIVRDRLTDGTTMICTVLSFAIPFTIYKLNAIFHKNTNPPWKEKKEREE